MHICLTGRYLKYVDSGNYDLLASHSVTAEQEQREKGKKRKLYESLGEEGNAHRSSSQEHGPATHSHSGESLRLNESVKKIFTILGNGKS